MNEQTHIFKFGGASVKNADAVRNVSTILELHQSKKIIVVISAMGKTTNLLESIVDSYWNSSSDLSKLIQTFKDYHNTIINELKLSSADFNQKKDDFYKALESKLKKKKTENYNFEYDQIVSFGELLSTLIVTEYLIIEKSKALWLDARNTIMTDNMYRESRVNWDMTQKAYINTVLPEFKTHDILVTQGFIGCTKDGTTTTLGREGSDFTASIFAYISDAKDVTIWKDVPGMLNADPKYFNGTILLKKISFKEAVELAYYGASVIHPKTIQPLKQKDISLYIKSFINPLKSGTLVQSSTKYDEDVPSYIFKEDQILISITPKDFSFVAEDHLTEIFSVLSKQQIRINLMQNSAISFSFLIDDKYDLDLLIKGLGLTYLVKYNKNLELLTIRHFDEKTIKRLTANKTILLTQKTREMARVILVS